MKIVQTSIPDVLVIEPTVFEDSRGFFMESFNKKDWKEWTGIDVEFVQDNHSSSSKGVVRGFHYQTEMIQGKLVRVVAGSIFDVALDLRKSSPTFGQHFAILLSAENRKQLWIPEGFAHAFMSLEENSEVLYKTTDYYNPDFEKCISWNDPELSVDWPDSDSEQLSDKDALGVPFKEAVCFS